MVKIQQLEIIAAHALLLEALNDRPQTPDEVARWRKEGERGQEDELVVWCLGDRSDGMSDPMAPLSMRIGIVENRCRPGWRAGPLHP